MSPRILVCLVFLLLLAPGCGSGGAQQEPAAGEADMAQSDTESPDLVSEDVGAPDSGVLDMATDAAPDAVGEDAAPDMGQAPLTPGDYCETIVDFFCPYYVRCGRMAGVQEVERCREVFVETCNSVYEPYYTALAEQGWLELDPEGVEACRQHLEQVECQAQLQDLDGGCGQMWRGQRPVSAACGVGVESFICQEGATCRVGLDFCGTCVAAGAAGEPCAEGNACVAGAACVEGTCVARSAPGQACSQAQPCVVGASCEGGVCQGFTVVALGEACDRANRCPYKSECVQGVCVEAALQGEPCTPAGCASGRCQGGVCVAPAQQGDPCQEDQECLSGLCAQGVCAGSLSGCVAP
jgi:hypothetical protein